MCAIASAFTFGREALLPDVFRRLVAELDTTQGAGLGGFRYYLDRHIEVDDGEHGPLAERLVEDLCGDAPDRWRSAEDAAIRSPGGPGRPLGRDRRTDRWDARQRTGHLNRAV